MKSCPVFLLGLQTDCPCIEEASISINSVWLLVGSHSQIGFVFSTVLRSRAFLVKMNRVLAKIVSDECGESMLDHEFTKMRNIKRKVGLMVNLCGQFNEVADAGNNGRREIIKCPDYLQPIDKSLKRAE